MSSSMDSVVAPCNKLFYRVTLNECAPYEWSICRQVFAWKHCHPLATGKLLLGLVKHGEILFLGHQCGVGLFLLCQFLGIRGEPPHQSLIVGDVADVLQQLRVHRIKLYRSHNVPCFIIVCFYNGGGGNLLHGKGNKSAIVTLISQNNLKTHVSCKSHSR